jgi:DNA mismatch endonuclease, patch repair protein
MTNSTESEPAASEPRRALMAKVRSQDTEPELRVRKWLHGMGSGSDSIGRILPGTPDIVLPRYRVAIFVHGCFWHQHSGCSRATVPRTRRAFWQDKLLRNQARDSRALKSLESIGWKSMVTWQCQCKDYRIFSRCFFLEVTRCSASLETEGHDEIKSTEQGETKLI